MVGQGDLYFINKRPENARQCFSVALSHVFFVSVVTSFPSFQHSVQTRHFRNQSVLELFVFPNPILHLKNVRFKITQWLALTQGDKFVFNLLILVDLVFQVIHCLAKILISLSKFHHLFTATEKRFSVRKQLILALNVLTHSGTT